MPVIGSLSHSLIRRILPEGTHVKVFVRSGVADGISLSVDPRFEVQYSAGVHEEVLLECLAAYLKPGDVFYDIGAHIGFISLVAARLVGHIGEVFSFEADPANAIRIAEHVQMNCLPQIQLVRAAVWSECGPLSFDRSPNLSSRNTGAVTDGTKKSPNGSLITVEGITLDRFVGNHRAPAVVKIDVEGSEEEVLKGAETLFRNSRPILICEIHHDRAADGVADWLQKVGYQWKWLEEGSGFPRHLIAYGTS